MFDEVKKSIQWGQETLTLETGKVMVKDEDVCLHCGLCAERCPTAAWDMQMFFYNTAKATPDIVSVK